jgi:uncharacterized protein HemY
VAGNNLAFLFVTEFGDVENARSIVDKLRLSRYGGDKKLPGERLNAEFLDTIGLIYKALNQPKEYTEMRALFEGAVQRYPYDPRMYLFLGHSYAGLQESAQAERMFNEAIRRAGQKNPLTPEQRQHVIDEATAAKQKLSAGR